MTGPAFALATDRDMREISSQHLDEIQRMPFFYIPTDDPDVMRSWGVALEQNVADNVRLYPGALVAPGFAGENASRGDLLYNGAEASAAFVPRP
jgi:hypothetical protein